MATAFPSDEENNLDEFDSLTKESDEVREMHCEDCEKELGTIVKADGFCVQCLIFFCSTCVRYHRKHFPQHTLQDSSSMPQDFGFDKCQKHPKEILKFYCYNCEFEICSKCKAEKHDLNKSHEVFHIPSCASSKKTNEQMEVTRSIDIAIEELPVRKLYTKRNLTKVKTNVDKISADIEKHKAKMIDRINEDNLFDLSYLNEKHLHEIDAFEKRRAEIIAGLDKEKTEILHRHQEEEKLAKEQFQNNYAEILAQINIKANNLLTEPRSNKMNETDARKLELVLTDIDKVEDKLNNLKKSVDKSKYLGEKCKHFVAVKKVKAEMERYFSEKRKFIKDIDIHILQFQEIYEYINAWSAQNKVAFGHLQDITKITNHYLQDIKFQFKPSSKNNSVVYRMCIIKYFLVIIESQNVSMKLICVFQGNVVSSMDLPGKPFDVTKVDENTVATSLTFAKKIQLLSVARDGNLSLAGNIHVGKQCYGIDYMNPYLIVACQNPGSIEILHLNGMCIKTLSNVKSPLHVLVDQENCSFYIIDKENSKTETVKKSNYSWEITNVSEKPYCSPNSHSGLLLETNGSVCMFQKQATSGYFNEKGRLYKFSKDLKEIIKTTQLETLGSGEIVCTLFCTNTLYVGNTNSEIFILRQLDRFSKYIGVAIRL